MTVKELPARHPSRMLQLGFQGGKNAVMSTQYHSIPCSNFTNILLEGVTPLEGRKKHVSIIPQLNKANKPSFRIPKLLTTWPMELHAFSHGSVFSWFQMLLMVLTYHSNPYGRQSNHNYQQKRVCLLTSVQNRFLMSQETSSPSLPIPIPFLPDEVPFGLSYFSQPLALG